MEVRSPDSGESSSLAMTPRDLEQDETGSNAGSITSHYPKVLPNNVMKKVLIVDDEEYVRGILRSMLEELGYESVEACDGDEGLKIFKQDTAQFSACVIDLTMPGMAGLELLELIREQNASVPVLLVSGYARHEVRQREARSTSISFLQKPFTMAQFKSAIDSHLNTTVKADSDSRLDSA